MTTKQFLGKRVLLLSPHPDDVAYSCGGLVDGVLQGSELALVTVFGRSTWALSKQLRAVGADEVSAVRAEEDRRYCASRGMRLRALSYPDASLRGYDDVSELGSPISADPVTESVCAAIAAEVAGARAEVVLAPAAIGDHVDHLIVHEAARRIQDDGLMCLFYEDIPYAAHLAADEVERVLTDERTMRPFDSYDISPTLPAKIAGMWMYESQTDQENIDDMLLHAGRSPGVAGRFHERLWMPVPAVS